MEADVPNKDDRLVDRISQLHDDLLHQILCDMPLIDAARSCILSRRWRRVWSRIPSLVFSDGDHPLNSAGNGAAASFNEFVEGVLSGLDHRHTKIQSFAFNITRPGTTSRLKTWVDHAVTHGVEELRLIIRNYDVDPFSLPPCGSLRLLFWESSYQQISALRLPASGSFNSLETLHLIEPRFSDGGALLSDMVSTRCPRLRRLEMHHPHGLGTSVLRIRSRTLESLEIRQDYYIMWGLTVIAENLKEFCLDGSIRRLELSAPRLEIFELLGVVYVHFWSGVLESLRAAAIVVLAKSPPSLAARRRRNAQNLLRAVANAAQVKAAIIRGGDQPEELLKGIDIKLHGVTELRLAVHSFPHVFREALAPLLKGCASLKRLSICICVNGKYQHEVVCDDPKGCCDQTPSWTSGGFSLDSLEEVTIQGLCPVLDHDGLDFVEFLCRRANLQRDTSAAGVGDDLGDVVRLIRTISD